MRGAFHTRKGNERLTERAKGGSVLLCGEAWCGVWLGRSLSAGKIPKVIRCLILCSVLLCTLEIGYALGERKRLEEEEAALRGRRRLGLGERSSSHEVIFLSR